MIIDQVSKELFKAGELKDFSAKLNAGKSANLAIVSSARSLIVACDFVRNEQSILLVVPGSDNAKIFANDLRMYLGADKVYEYANFEFAAQSKISCMQKAKKLQAIYSIFKAQKKIVVASARSLLRNLPSNIKELCKPIILTEGKEYDMKSLISKFSNLGYTRIDALDGPGTFSVKGGNIDIYPAQLDYALRLEFFGDELEDIRKIVPSTGQSIASLKQVEIFGASLSVYGDGEIFRVNEKLKSQARVNKVIRDYLEKLERKVEFEEIEFLEPYMFNKMLCLTELINKKTKIYLDEPRAIMDDMRHYYDELDVSFKNAGFNKNDIFSNYSDISFKDFQTIQLLSLMQKGIEVDSKLTLKRPKKYHNFDELIGLLKDYRESGFATILSLPNSKARENIKQDLAQEGVTLIDAYSTKVNKLENKYVYVSDFPAKMSYLIPDSKIAVITLSGTNLILAGSSEYYDQAKRDYIDITKITFPYKPGDYVVHSFHGIAYFKDIVKREINGSIRDYLLLEYAENDRLYVPIEQFGRVTKYVGPQGFKPRLTRLGTADWSSAMGKARKATRKMAFDLVDVYSRRALAKGHAFSKDNKAQKKMEDDFPYLETDDQLQAIEEVKQDMQSLKPMDRLICGDVGFGKTEVALRAVFKCVSDKMQVMVLCPTTILAQQHYSTFVSRLEKYNVSVDVLSRFKTAKEAKLIAEKFQSGKLDVLIGTHRLLSRDINPKNLGLIIIDEEQRFGVGHKEQLKNFRESVDVLTLSATPIPRTMQMATSGVRDMSLILTPPSDRKAVDVFVGEWDIDIVSEAIRREIERGGQVYYLSNRVRSIKDAAKRVGIAAGEARIASVHGKMSKDQLEIVMEDFSAKKFDVLVSTTIIENGIDNPNTNTLIVEDAQNLGLAQMYQLKGRVGRSVEQAYAYFMFKDSAMLSKDSVARLSAIDEFRDLGSGVQIAMRDLEIRGSGNFLGAEQSGNVSHIGFDLFAQMLKSAIENVESNNLDKDDEDQDYLKPSISDVAVSIPGSAYLSSDIIVDVDKRVAWYRRFSAAQSLDEVFVLEKALKKEYKDLDEISVNFLLKSKIAAYALNNGINLVSVFRSKLVLEGMNLKSSQVKELEQIDGRYFSQRKKISIPLDNIIDKDPQIIFGQIFDFLISWDF